MCVRTKARNNDMESIAGEHKATNHRMECIATKAATPYLLISWTVDGLNPSLSDTCFFSDLEVLILPRTLVANTCRQGGKAQSYLLACHCSSSS